MLKQVLQIALGILLSVALLGIGFGGAYYVMDDMSSPQDLPTDTNNQETNENNDVNIVNTTGDSAVESSQDALTGVVSIYTEQDGELTSQGSGFVYSDNHIMTNEHVITEADTFYVQYSEGEWSNAELVGEDSDTDIAILEPAERPDYAEPLPLQETLPERGTPVVALGAPGDLDGTVTTGVVSGTERSMETESEFAIPDSIQTDAALNPGNSGGPLVNHDDGSVVGVNRATDGENIGFAVSARLANHVGQSLIDTGDHSHSYVGVRTVELSPLTQQEGDEFDVDNGLIVEEIVDESPSEGVLNDANSSEGPDVITAIDGEPVYDNEDLTSYIMRSKMPGDEVELDVYRNGGEETVTLELGSRE